jgi:hypothetical protein
MPAIVFELDDLRRDARIQKLLTRFPQAATWGAYLLALDVRSRALRNLSGPILTARRGAGGGLLGFVAAQMPIVESDGVWWGLPRGADPRAKQGAKLEVGGDIVAKPGKALRVPLQPALTAKGVDRYTGVPLRTVGGFFVVRPKTGPLSGQAVLARTDYKGKRGRIQFWYVLRQRVTLKPHPWLRTSLEQADAARADVLSRTAAFLLEQQS